MASSQGTAGQKILLKELKLQSFHSEVFVFYLEVFWAGKCHATTYLLKQRSKNTLRTNEYSIQPIN